MKTFVQEATARLGFLRTEFGFTGPEVVQDETGVCPLLRRIRSGRADLGIEVSLVLSYMGEEYVAVHLLLSMNPDRIAGLETGHRTARTGYQMRRAVDLQAEAVRKLMSAEA